MPDEGQVLPGLDGQVEIGQDRLVFGIAEVKVLELDLPLERRHIPPVGLDHIRVGVDQGKDPLGCGKPGLDLGPEGGQVQHREEELVQADDEQVPGADRDHACRGAHPARVDQDAGKDTAQGIQRREDQRQHEAALHVDPVRLLVGFVEGLEDALLLAEVLGDRDAADGFLDGGIDIRHGLHAALRHAPGQPAEAGSHQEHDRQEGQQHQRQAATRCGTTTMPRRTAWTIWAATSVMMMTSCPKSLVSEVMRETMRPEENWS